MIYASTVRRRIPDPSTKHLPPCCATSTILTGGRGGSLRRSSDLQSPPDVDLHKVAPGLYRRVLLNLENIPDSQNYRKI